MITFGFVLLNVASALMLSAQLECHCKVPLQSPILPVQTLTASMLACLSRVARLPFLRSRPGSLYAESGAQGREEADPV